MSKSLVSEMRNLSWAMEPKSLASFFMRLGAIDEYNAKNLQDIEVAQSKRPVKVEGKTAVINISGVLMKKVPSIFRWFNIDATSYQEVSEQIGEATNNDAVTDIQLRIESPGGAVAGVMETAEAIKNAAAKKPVRAVVEDMAASGAYWLASQAGQITANQNALIGSIGVFQVLLDASKMAEQDGIKVIVVKSGEHKGTGVFGAEITEEQLKPIQDVIDGLAANFVAAVASGRKKSKEEIEELASGRVWLADKALKLGLIDGLSAAQSDNAENSNEISNFRSETMSENKTETATAAVDVEAVKVEAKNEASAENLKRFSDLKAAFHDDLAFASEQFEKGASVEQAKAAYCDVLRAKLAAKKDEPDEAAAEGAAPIEHNDSAGVSADGDFMSQARALAADENISVTAAMKKLAKQNPQLHREYVANIGKEVK